jgi:hypothetical protein
MTRKLWIVLSTPDRSPPLRGTHLGDLFVCQFTYIEGMRAFPVGAPSETVR